jgi:hypothetical protein
MDHGRIGCGMGFVAVPDARNGDARFEPSGNCVDAEAVGVLIRNDERAAFERFDLVAIFGSEVSGLASGVNAEDLLEQQQRADDAGDSAGIRDGVGERGQNEPVGIDARKRSQRLSGSTKRRRVCRCAGENAKHGGRDRSPRASRRVVHPQPRGQRSPRRGRSSSHPAGAVLRRSPARVGDRW